jgi:hypothetical protein
MSDVVCVIYNNTGDTIQIEASSGFLLQTGANQAYTIASDPAGVSIKRSDSEHPPITITLQGRQGGTAAGITAGTCLCLTNGTALDLGLSESLVLTINPSNGMTVQGVQCGEGKT